MNSLKSIFIMFSALLVGGLLLSSCKMGDGTNKYNNTGIFTIENDGTGYTLYADYGGVIRPTTASVNELTNGKGLKSGDRAYLLYSYTDNNIKTIGEKGSYIDQAELISGQMLIMQNILTQDQAVSGNLLAKDSLFSFANNVTNLQFGAYRGYMTASYTGRFSVVSNKAYLPTLNLIYDPAENERPNTLKLTAVYNRHSAADVQASSQAFLSTYPLSSYSNSIMGKDSIEVSIDGLGFTKPITFKIGRLDLTPGNYIYFPN